MAEPIRTKEKKDGLKPNNQFLNSPKLSEFSYSRCGDFLIFENSF